MEVIPSFAFENFSFSFTKQKMVIARRNRAGSPHLTLSWANQSGEIDLHLTSTRTVITSSGHRAVEKLHQPLLRISENDLARAGTAMERLFHRHYLAHLAHDYRRYRVGWLQRKGYYVSLQSEKDISEWIRSIAPRIKRKHRLNLARDLASDRLPAFLRENVYPAEVLRLIDPADYIMPFSAYRVVNGRLKNSHELMLGCHPASDGRPGWWGFRQRATRRFSATMNRVTDEVVRRLARPQHRDAFEQVVTALGLEELPDFAQSIASIRASLESSLHSPGAAV